MKGSPEGSGWGGAGAAEPGPARGVRARVNAPSLRHCGVALALVVASCSKSTTSRFGDDGGTDMAVDAAPAHTSDTRDTGPSADTTVADTTVATDARADMPDDGERPAIRTIAPVCPMAGAMGGTAWTGWGNLQHPRILELEVGEVSEPVFGQVYQDGVTNLPGLAAGWEGQLMVGPLGTNPVDQPGCFRALDAEFNVDSGNNDEWWVRLQPDRPGLWGMFYRFRPPGGAWRYGDLNGSDDGVSNAEAAILAVDDPAGPDEIRVLTLNLRCRADQWEERFDIMIEALVAMQPHLLGLQEDCSVPGGTPQSHELAARLALRLDRGYEVFNLVTHQAMHPEGTFDEGIALLSAFPIDAHLPLDLPFANFPRKALVADVRLGGGKLLRVINTHLDFGAENGAVREQEAAAIVAELGAGPTVVMGDLNDVPGSPMYVTFDVLLDDAWTIAGNGDGLTMPSNLPTRRIDYIWTLGLQTQSIELVDGVVGGLHLSDHKGVAAVLTRD